MSELKFEEWLDNSKYVLAKDSTKKAMLDAWEGAIDTRQSPKQMIAEGLREMVKDMKFVDKVAGDSAFRIDYAVTKDLMLCMIDVCESEGGE